MRDKAVDRSSDAVVDCCQLIVGEIGKAAVEFSFIYVKIVRELFNSARLVHVS